MKLGKQAPRLDKRTFRLSRYLPAILPPAPKMVDWASRVPYYPLYLNDIEGICVGATAGHQINQWTRYASGREVFPTDQDIQKSYIDVGGYDPAQTNPDGTNPTDNGMNILEFLSYWRKTGVGGHKILAYASVDLSRLDQIRQAIALFGSLFIGVNLPLTAQDQDSLWAVPKGGAFGDASPGSWGGHAVPICEYSPSTLTLVTWGQTMQMTWEFLKAYCDEAWCVLSPDWIAASGLSPGQFNLAQLQADLALL